MACLRLVTFLPERPDLSCPRFISCIARSTFLPAFLRPLFFRDVLFLREVDFFRDVLFFRVVLFLREVDFLREVLFLRAAI